MSGRMSQATFLRAMRELNFQGDSKLVWASAPVQWSHVASAWVECKDTLNRGVPGFISQEDVVD